MLSYHVLVLPAVVCCWLLLVVVIVVLLVEVFSLLLSKLLLIILDKFSVDASSAVIETGLLTLSLLNISNRVLFCHYGFAVCIC